ncbi:MAG: hypothetical protein ACPGO7_01910 [Alphaproteobacteria bacterium]
MVDLDTNQARMIAALSALENKIQVLTAKVSDLEGELTRVREAGEGALKDLDQALAQIDELGSNSHG